MKHSGIPEEEIRLDSNAEVIFGKYCISSYCSNCGMTLTVTFQRLSLSLRPKSGGIVIQVRQNTVIVQMSSPGQQSLSLDQ